MKRTSPKTKIVCTIGPASESPGILKELILAGMSVARLNFSHGTQSEHAEKITRIRDVSTNLGIPVCILQDLAGPKIRVGHIPDPGIRLEAGRKFVLTTEQLVGSEERVSVSYPHLSEDAKKGDRILLADGYMELKVNAVKAPEIHCEVLTGGILTSNKGMSLPTSTIRTPAITGKDREDLLFGLEKGVDYVALSFVRKVEDIIEIKEIINHEGADVPVIAKIEKHEAIEHIQEIMRVADGIMVARGDLGVEIPLERVPVIQKQLIHRANLEGKPVITATQMLRSMVNSTRPTRAEAADVANAVLDGTDAVMLSEETASGDYPVEAVKYMARIAERAEAIFPHDKYLGEYLGLMPKNQVAESVAHATCVSAHHLGAAAIVAPTQSGQTARQISRFRPRCPIIALSPNPSTVRRLCLFPGCFPRLVPQARDTDDMIEKAAAAALETGRVSKGNIVIITAGHPAGAPGTTNMMQVKRL